MAKIQYNTPEGASGELELTAERMTLGRGDDNMLVIADASVSSHHGEVALEGGTWTFTDLGSTNGTKVADQRVDRIELSHGGNFTIGNVECVFVGDAVEEPEPEPEPAYEAPTRSAPTSAGYAATAIDRSRRSGFGPKVKEKNPGAAPLMFLGVLGLLACGAAVYLFNQMTA